MVTCKLCTPKRFFNNRSKLMKHRFKAHVLIMKRGYNNMLAPAPALAEQSKTVEYSFYNSPRELVLDLGDYKISITKKGAS